MYPFHGAEAAAILKRCRRTIVVENNFTGQFARHLRAESGHAADHVLTRYDGEPFEPAWIAERVATLLDGKALDLRVAEHEAREMAYHFVRIHMQDKARPGRLQQVGESGYGEPLWIVELVARTGGQPEGMLLIGRETGSLFGWYPTLPGVLGDAAPGPLTPSAPPGGRPWPLQS
jgi:hypothetical protein